MRCLAIEMAAQLAGLTEFFVFEHTLRADIAKRPCQLIVMGIAAGEAVIVDEYLELAFAQRRAVQMRQMVHRGAGGMHRRLVDQMYATEKARISGDRCRHCCQMPKKRHS